MTEALRVLAIGALPTLAAPPAQAAGCVVESRSTLADGLAALTDADDFDAIVLDGALAGAAAADVEAIAARAALVVVLHDPDAEHALAWLRRGAHDVISPDEATGLRRIRFAVERRRCAQAHDPAYSTDVSTGLPHRQQLIEHLSQLLALREREPSPMAVLVLRVVSIGAAGTPLAGAEGDALRRKIAVRLRAGVRASDVVASLGEDSFAVLLGSLLAAADAERVAAKLLALVISPYAVAGRDVAVAVATGISQFPKDGMLAEKLLRRAVALAVAAPLIEGAGAAHAQDARGNARAAANDEV